MTQASVAANMLMSTPMSMTERVRAVAEGRSGVAKAEHLSVSSDNEEHARQKRGLNDRPGYSAQRVARLRAQRGRRLESHEAEDRKHHTQADSARIHTRKMKLWTIEMKPMPEQQRCRNDRDQRNRDALDIQHQASGHLDVVIRDEPSDPCG
jgi:hypothetical protein